MHSFALFGVEVEKKTENHPVDPKTYSEKMGEKEAHRFGIHSRKARGEKSLARTTPRKDDLCTVL